MLSDRITYGLTTLGGLAFLHYDPTGTLQIVGIIVTLGGLIGLLGAKVLGVAVTSAEEIGKKTL